MIIHDPYHDDLQDYLKGFIDLKELSGRIYNRGEEERNEFLKKLKEQIEEDKAKKNVRKGFLFSVSL